MSAASASSSPVIMYGSHICCAGTAIAVDAEAGSSSAGLRRFNLTPMDSAKLNSKIEVPAETLAILAEISQEINASLNLDEVLPNAAALIKRLIDYEAFAVLLPEEGTDQMYFRFAIGHRQEVVDHWRIPMGEGIIGAAAATGRAIRVGDVRGDSRYLNALDAVRSELAVPLIV